LSKNFVKFNFDKPKRKGVGRVGEIESVGEFHMRFGVLQRTLRREKVIKLCLQQKRLEVVLSRKESRCDIPHLGET